MSYVSSNAWHWRSAVSFVDKILEGAKPADIPVEQPTMFERVINVKTAKALGITMPQSLLPRSGRGDSVMDSSARSRLSHYSPQPSVRLIR